MVCRAREAAAMSFEMCSGMGIGAHQEAPGDARGGTAQRSLRMRSGPWPVEIARRPG